MSNSTSSQPASSAVNSFGANAVSSAMRFSHVHSAGLAYLLTQIANGAHPLRYAKAAAETNLAKSVESSSVLVVMPTTASAEKLVEDLYFFLPPEGDAAGLESSSTVSVLPFLPWDVLPFDAISPSTAISAERIVSLTRLLQKRTAVVVTTIDALAQRIVTPQTLTASSWDIAIGQALDRDAAVVEFDKRGYLRSTLVEEVGQLAVRGAVIDFFPANTPHPVRLELFGDVVESIRYFEADTQRSLHAVEQIQVLSVREFFPPSAFDNNKSGNSNDTAAVIDALQQRGNTIGVPTRAIKSLEEAILQNSTWPGVDHLQPLLAESSASLLDYLQANTKIVICDEVATLARIEEFAEIVNEQAQKATEEGRMFPAPESAYTNAKLLQEQLQQKTQFYFDSLDLLSFNSDQSAGDEKESRAVVKYNRSIHDAEPLSILSNSELQTALRVKRYKEQPFLPLKEELERRLSEGFLVAILVSHPSRIRRIQELLAAYELKANAYDGGFAPWHSYHQQNNNSIQQRLWILQGQLSSGVRVAHDRLLLVSDLELFPEVRSRKRNSSGAASVRRFVSTLSQLKENDYVVHTEHGIGKYRGLKQLTIEGKVGDFILLEYAEESKLFLPVENIGRLQKYVGAEGKQPVLSKLGTKAWEKTKNKIKEDVAQLAGQLLKLYAQRSVSRGFSFGPVGEEDARFAETFGFEETPDQSKAIDDALQDMATDKPMDRLVCGDVGYGKTEVALRAAFKAASSGRQVAVLVPTTILADQHYNNFKERLSDFPIKVGCISRFFSAADNKNTLAELAGGKLDIIIGTHRLLQRDVYFKNLGLVIIDEEHRFGVAHKEKLKQLKTNVDVLTLTATPIPRTLHLSLVGLRDLSLIESPPCDRQVIRTYIATYEESVVREAIVRELSRSGQVFFVHNRVEDIYNFTEGIRALVPEAKIGIAHGQMKEKELETVMHQFVNKEIDVLVTTTIVESGLDIPNANTIIIHHADKFGLAQLYQLRGRVGRSSRRAYAYLLISNTAQLGPEARKRLQVLQSLDDLGVGFRLALQDMEIRGAGNILGKDQSGHINLIGFELYSRLLRDAVQELKIDEGMAAAEETPQQLVVDPEVHIGFPAHIPPDYIPDVAERLLLYQRLVDLRDRAHGFAMAEEIEDRFGRLPVAVEQLVELMCFRALLRKTQISAAAYKDGTLRLTFHPQAEVDPQRLLQTVEKSGGRLKLRPPSVLLASVEKTDIESPDDLTKVVQEIATQAGIR